jgi:ubiquinol-cytochrome c reductase cytochrome b subunit
MSRWLADFFLFLTAGTLAFGSSAGALKRGAADFSASGCLHCHTIHNVGGHKGPDLSGVGRLLSQAQIRAQITRGGKEMPPFRDVLEPTVIDDLVAYLHSCREKTKK